jgi:hypothetical protein
MQRKFVSDRHLYADLDGLDNVHQIAKFTLRGASDAAEALAAFAMSGNSVLVGGRSVGAVLENDIQKSAGGAIRFAVQVTSSSDWKLLPQNIVHGAQIAAHQSRSGAGLYIDAITLQDMSPLNLGEARKSDQGDVLMKSGTFGERHVMKIGGADPQVKPSAGLAKLIDDLSKSSSSNAEHLMHAHGHLEKAGEHLAAAQKRYAFDNNIRGAVKSHADAMECLAKIDFPDQDTIPSLPRPSGKPEPADANERDQETFRGPIGRWGGETTGARPDPDVVTSDQPGRKMSRADANDAFAKAFTPEGRARSRRSVTFHR